MLSCPSAVTCSRAIYSPSPAGLSLPLLGRHLGARQFSGHAASRSASASAGSELPFVESLPSIALSSAAVIKTWGRRPLGSWEHARREVLLLWSCPFCRVPLAPDPSVTARRGVTRGERRAAGRGQALAPRRRQARVPARREVPGR